MAKANWTSDQILESKLRQMGVGWKYDKSVPLDKIDIHGSRRNNARLKDQWNENLSIEYGVAMEEGDIFPAPALRAVFGGGYKFYVLSGNHRVGAANLLGDKTIEAYIVDSSDEMVLETITRAANRWMGDRQSKDEAVEHARALIAKYGRTQQQMAKLFGLKPAWLSLSLRAEDLRDELENIGVPAREIPRSTIMTLAQLDGNTSVMHKAALVTAKYHVTGERVKLMVEQAKSTKSENGMLEVIEEHEAKLRQEEAAASMPRPTPIFKRSKRTKMFRHLNTLHNFLLAGNNGKEFATLQQLGITSGSDRGELRDRFREVKLKFEKLFSLDDKERDARKHTGVVSKYRETQRSK